MTSPQHNFHNDLGFAKDCEPHFEAAYRKFFPDFDHVMTVEDKAMQRLGIDRIIIMEGGHGVTVEEKAEGKPAR